MNVVFPTLSTLYCCDDPIYLFGIFYHHPNPYFFIFKLIQNGEHIGIQI